MSGKQTGLVAALSSIIGVDLEQSVSHVKKLLLNERMPLSFDLFKQYSQSIRALQELITVLPPTQGNEEKAKGEQDAVEGVINDICLPFLQSFAPSCDSRTDLSAAVLNICDMIFVCLKRSSQEIAVKILELCLQSLTAFYRECSRHSESASDQTLDIMCALELLCTALEIPTLPDDNHHKDLYDNLFSASLSILPHLEEKTANRLVSFVIIKLIQQQIKNKDTFLQQVWKSVEADITQSQEKQMSSRSLQQHLSMMCSMANFFLPVTDEPVQPDIRQYRAFWELVQLGLYNDNPAIRKRSMYLLKRIIDTCEKSDSDLIATDPSSENSSLAYFWWSKQQQKNLSKIWEDVILLLETLDEKQTHVIKPILPRMQTLINASKLENGSVLLHTSWLVTLLMRALCHESVYIIRWAAETVLFMDFCTVPFMQQGQLQILTQQLLVFLQDLKLYQRPDGSPAGSCSSVGAGLKHFFASVCQSLDHKHHKVEFLQHVLLTLRKENWSSAPLVFITQGLSCITPDAVLDHTTLAYIREIIIASLTTLENFTRGAIECFLTKTVLHLIDKSVLSIEDLMETLAVMEREESLQRGTDLWSTVVSFLLASVSDDLHPAWSWPGLQEALQTMVDSYLTVSADATGSPLAETLRVTKIGRLVALMSDCEYKMNGTDSDLKDGHTIENVPAKLLTASLLKTVDIINSINTRLYMPVLKADRAIYLLLLCAKEFGKGKSVTQDPCYKEMCSLIHSCWSELLVYVERRTLLSMQEGEHQSIDLDLVIFYTDAVKSLGVFLPFGVGMSGLDKLFDTCEKTMKTPSTVLPLQQVAAISLMSSIAQVVDSTLNKRLEESSTVADEGVKELSHKLWRVFSSMPLNCDIFMAWKGGSSAHHGRQVCQYMVSLWECLRVLLSRKPGLRQAPPILDASLEAFSVSSGESDIPIMQCLELIMPELLSSLEHHDKVIQVIKIAWSKVHEEIKSWSFWLKMEAFVNMVLQRHLLMLASKQDTEIGAYITEVLDRFFKVGQEKSGMLNLVIARLCQLWSEPDGIALATRMVPTIVDACMFGTLHKKTERLWLDVCMYIETLKEDCSVNEILSSSSKNDIYVRLMAINFLSTLKLGITDHETLAMAVLHEAWHRYFSLAQISTFRQFTNTLPHRQKHRLVQIFPLLDQFINQNSCYEFYKNAWDGLVLECHPSVRQNLEWLVMRLVQRYPHELLPSLWKHFDQFSDKRNVSLLSLLHVVARLGPEIPVELREDFYMQAMPLVVPWTMAHHFNTRLHGQASMYQLWKQCERMQLQAKKFKIVESCMDFLMENGNSSPVLGKLLDNYFYNHFHFLKDYSMETLFYTLPRLACLNDDEWMHPDLFCQIDATWKAGSDFHLMPLCNESQTLAACEPGPWKMKATAETNEDVCESMDGDVQKKIIPWRLMTPDSHAEQEYSYRKKGRKPDGLVLVTSLINKVPNLGGLCRTSEIFGVSEFVIGNLSYLNDRMFQSLSVTAEKWIPITEVPSFRVSEFLEEKKRESYTLVGVEQTANSVDLTKYKFPKKTLLLLGNEKEGIPPDMLQQLDVCVEIPQQGIIRSLNVHVSGALLVWEYTRQQMELSDAE